MKIECTRKQQGRLIELIREHCKGELCALASSCNKYDTCIETLMHDIEWNIVEEENGNDSK